MMAAPVLSEDQAKAALDVLSACNGNQTRAAKMLGLSRSAFQNRIAIAEMRYKMAMEPDLGSIPDGQKLRGVSTLYGPDGQIKAQWVKTDADRERTEELLKAVADELAMSLPRQKPIAKPIKTDECLANCYTLTDCHVGMLAWHKENLESDWDVTIAERVLTGCFEYMVNASPKAKVGILAQLGDFLHSDGLAAVTPTSGHLLDQDGRFPKVVQAAIRILRRIINFALAKHEKVIVLMAEGNHDLASSVWLRAMFSALYEDEPRVEVIQSEMPYYVYQHGETMIAWHHGHLKKPDQLPLLFAAQFPGVWGSTSKRYAHCGHWHHVSEKEHSGITVIQHPTLASRDAYASRGGWIAERSCTSITYHSKFGQVARNTVTPEMLEQ